jgi:hypothetical protein
MCLAIRDVEKSRTPANNTRVRWKALKLVLGGDGKVRLESIYFKSKWRIGAEKRAIPARYFTEPKDIGIHTFVTSEDALRYCQSQSGMSDDLTWFIGRVKEFKKHRWIYAIRVYAKVEVRSFNRSGTWSTDFNTETPSETWKKARIVSLYDVTGKLITRRVQRLLSRKVK